MTSTSQIDPAGPTANTTIVYDLLGRKTQMTDADMGMWSYTYNGFGELIQQTNANGHYSLMNYDALGRMNQRRDFRLGGALETNAIWAYELNALNGYCPVGKGAIGTLCYEQVSNSAGTLNDNGSCDYYRLLQAVREQADAPAVWEKWVLYMLTAVERARIRLSQAHPDTSLP